MTYQRTFPVVMALWLLAATPVAAGAFLAELEDLPLAPGLSEGGGGVLFDAPSGRIVEAQASGSVTAAQIDAFYAQTLPQLGWEKLGETTYRRDNEVLRIDIDGNSRPTLVRFSVVPQ